MSFQADAGALDPVMGLLARDEIRSLTVQAPTLEELFLSHYGPDADAPITWPAGGDKALGAP